MSLTVAQSDVRAVTPSARPHMKGKTARKLQIGSGYSAGDTAERWVGIGRWLSACIAAALSTTALYAITPGVTKLNGTISVRGAAVTVLAPHGGKLIKLNVRKGDRVTAGQAIGEIANADAERDRAAAEVERASLEVQAARLEAERDLAETFTPPAAGEANDRTRALQDTEQQTFATRRAAHIASKAALADQLTVLTQDITAAGVTLAARLKDRDITERELANLRPYLEKGAISAASLGALERNSSRIHTEVATLKSDIAKLKETKSDVAARLTGADLAYSANAADELTRVAARLAMATERASAASSGAASSAVVAPVTGRVVRVSPQDGEMIAAEPVAEIVPDDRSLAIAFHDASATAGGTKPGQDVRVGFAAQDGRGTVHIPGTIDGAGETGAVVSVDQSTLASLAVDQHPADGAAASLEVITEPALIEIPVLAPVGRFIARASAAN